MTNKKALHRAKAICKKCIPGVMLRFQRKIFFSIKEYKLIGCQGPIGTIF